MRVNAPSLNIVYIDVLRWSWRPLASILVMDPSGAEAEVSCPRHRESRLQCGHSAQLTTNRGLPSR